MTVQPVLADADAEALVRASAARQGVPIELALAVGRKESNLRCGRVGRHGEVGPLQILPATSRGIGLPVTRHSSCAAQTEAGMKHLAMCLRGMGGNRWAGAACHNQGFSAIRGRLTAAAKRYANAVFLK